MQHIMVLRAAGELSWAKMVQTRKWFTSPIIDRLPPCVTPNRLSWSRIGLAPILCWILLWQQRWLSPSFWAIITSYFFFYLLLIYVAVSDVIDGDLAKKRGVESKEGAFLDPLADRIVICPAVGVLFWLSGKVLPSLVIATGLISGLLRLVLFKKKELPTETNKANKCGKAKALFQILAIAIGIAHIRTGRYVLWLALLLGVISFFELRNAILTNKFRQFKNSLD